jgi:hypothetical protein
LRLRDERENIDIYRCVIAPSLGFFEPTPGMSFCRYCYCLCQTANFPIASDFGWRLLDASSNYDIEQNENGSNLDYSAPSLGIVVAVLSADGHFELEPGWVRLQTQQRALAEISAELTLSYFTLFLKDWFDTNIGHLAAQVRAHISPVGVDAGWLPMVPLSLQEPVNPNKRSGTTDFSMMPPVPIICASAVLNACR